MKTLQDYVKPHGQRDLQFEPGTKWEYSNYGFLLLGGALMSNRVLRDKTLAGATCPQFTTGAYGFGFQLGRWDEARTYGHGGGAPGMNGILGVYPEPGQSVIVLCNLDSPSASRLGDWLHARMQFK